MSDQNVYDDPVFFAGYQKLRENPGSANALVEQPAIRALCPDVAGKAVLDLGCGCGENCAEFARRGASRVVGLDLSGNMLAVAKQVCAGECVEFVRLSMNDLDQLEGEFDIVVSSLAFHYIQHFDRLLSSIHSILRDGGVLVFSQEHPMTTAQTGEEYWTKTPQGEVMHYNLTSYADEGERHAKWIVEDVVKYHRTFSQIVNQLVRAGFEIDTMQEPIPTAAQMEQYSGARKCVHKPDFLLVRAIKKPTQPIVE